VGDLVTQAVVFVVEFADALVGKAESVAQGCLAGRFLSGCSGSGSWFAECRDPADFVFQVGLGVEPGSGDAGVFGDGGEVDRCPGLVEVVQGGDSFDAGGFVTFLGGGSEVNAVVRAHLR
jgi:hypothetical protein